MSKSCACGCGRAIRPPSRFVMGHHQRKSGREYIQEDRGYDSPCWVWQLGKNKAGYSAATHKGRAVNAHRLYYERAKGPIPEGLQIDHLCRQKDCVNPEHLEAVSCGENLRRASKLSPEDVRAIRGWAGVGGWSQGRIAKAWGIQQSTVSKLVRGERWQGV